jgi:filamentous hemagglutinin family protein
MKSNIYVLSFFFYFFLNCLSNISVLAEVVADQTISTPTHTNVKQVGNFIEISEGTEAGINLFHIFSEFSIKEANVVHFVNNNSAIQNVISRVTGTSASEIFGRIEAGGSFPNFNLFLLNSNGIYFGPNTSLDLKGSFVATTANAIQFGDRGFFSASNTNDLSLLTIQPSAFFFDQLRPNPIRYQFNNQPVTGLEVLNDQSLLLLGGDVIIDGGVLTAPNGRIELGGLAEPGTVALKINENNLSLSFSESVMRANVLLTNSAKVDVTDKGSGVIQVSAQNLEILEQSILRAGITDALVSNNSSNAIAISINATEAVILNDSFITSRVGNNATGNSGDILINAGSLSLVDGSELNAVSRGNGNGGNITIITRDQVELKGASEGFPSAINTGIPLLTAQGNSGNVTIQANSLSLSDGAIIRSSVLGKGDTGSIFIQVNGLVSLENTTLSEFNSEIRTIVEAGAIGNGGQIDIQAASLSLTGGSRLNTFVSSPAEGLSGGKGNGGDIFVRTSDSLNISGVGINGESSGIFSSTQEGAEGRAGNITVNTRSFHIADGGVIAAQTENSSLGGNIIINAITLEAKNGGKIITTASNLGNAGDINVTAIDHVTLSGSDITFDYRLAKFGESIVGHLGATSGLFAESSGDGIAGNLTVETGKMNISDGAQVSVSSPQGQAGNLAIKANSLSLDRGSITAETGKRVPKEEANITLQVKDIFRLENESLISATANGDANGGNIDIDPIAVFAFPSTGPNGSDIIAKAERGNGGKIKINAQSIFGIAKRPAMSGNQTNDIDTSSLSGSSGQIQINTTTDPNQGLIELPVTVVDPNYLVAQNPCRRSTSSQFTLSGRGGLPSSVSEDLNSESTLVGLVEPETTHIDQSAKQVSKAPTSASPLSSSRIVPAQGWIYNNKGEVVLVAYKPTITEPQRLQSAHPGCPI